MSLLIVLLFWFWVFLIWDTEPTGPPLRRPYTPPKRVYKQDAPPLSVKAEEVEPDPSHY